MSDETLKDKLSDFLSVSPDVFWETDTTGLLTFVSMQITSLVDQPPEALIGKPLTTLFANKLCNKDWQEWAQQCLQGKLQPLHPMPVVAQDGRVLYVSAYAQRFARGFRGYLRDVSEAVESTLNASEIEQQLADTIEAIPYGVALFDKEDKLVFINSKNREAFEGLDHMMRSGTPFEDIVRESFVVGSQPVEQDLVEEYTQRRMELHRGQYGRREVCMRDDIWVEISEHLTPEGNVVVSWADLTLQKRRQQALASLLSDTGNSLIVQERASKAIALAMGCRFGGVVRLNEDRSTAKVVALWDTDHFVPSFAYDYQKAPCNAVYEQGGYVHLDENIQCDFIPKEFIQHDEIIDYHGLALRDQKGEIIGHIFAMEDRHEKVHDNNHHGNQQGREIFHLIGHWVEMEFRRQELYQTNMEAQKRFRDFAEVSSDWFWEMDENFKFNLISENAPETARQKLVEMITVAHDTPTHEWTLSTLSQANQKFIPRRAFRDIHMAVPITDENGAPSELMFLVSGRPIFDDQGEFLGYRGTCTDISDVLEANQRAARMETWLWEALESSPEAFVLYDKDDNMLICNKKYKDVFFPQAADKVIPGISFKESMDLFLSQGICDISPEKIPQWRASRLRHRGLSDGGPYNETYVNGHIYIAIEHRTREGGIAAFYVDITQMREQEKILKKAKEEAENANRSKSDFLANISHELRTPLNAIIGFSELIREDLAGPPNSPKYKEYIGDIHNSGMHLMELINDILDLSKAEAGAIEGVARMTDCVDIVESCVKLMGPRAERAYVKLNIDYEKSMPYLWIDPKHLRQVLLNLISNAVKFTPEGGKVEIKINTDAAGMHVVISDTGIGMRPEDVPKAMAPFGQIDSSLARKYNGTGLGLPLTKRLMEYYQSDIEIDTAPGHGTVISLHFPVDRLRYPDAPALSEAAE